MAEAWLYPSPNEPSHVIYRGPAAGTRARNGLHFCTNTAMLLLRSISSPCRRRRSGLVLFFVVEHSAARSALQRDAASLGRLGRAAPPQDVRGGGSVSLRH